MARDNNTLVPVWTLATTATPNVPEILTQDGTMTPARLNQLRGALSALADSPIVTLEARPLRERSDSKAGISLDAASPLARHLANLIGETAKSAPAAASVEAAGEVVYRMVVPAKVAAQVGKGLVKSMPSKTVAGGIHGALVNASGIAAQASFVPVAGAEVAAVGAAGGAAGAGIAGATAITVAGPLILLAVAVGVSAYADHQRQLAIQNITELLEELHENHLNAERSDLGGCRDAVDGATAILLDRGHIGASLGLDSAVYAISRSMDNADRRVTRWTEALDALPEDGVSLTAIQQAFPGADTKGGRFRAHLELAGLAIALKRRVIVLQAVEHAQRDEGNPFEEFMHKLRKDQVRVDELEGRITSVLQRLGTLKLRAPSTWQDTVKTRGKVDELLSASYRLRELGDRASNQLDGDLVIDIEQHSDGSVIVFPAALAS